MATVTRHQCTLTATRSAAQSEGRAWQQPCKLPQPTKPHPSLASLALSRVTFQGWSRHSTVSLLLLGMALSLLLQRCCWNSQCVRGDPSISG